ncbi:MAG: nitrous oxide reductase accessory protein NosL [Paenibacillus sp.]|nr:nitrous oxide reductase accessory protein NosL [Paenibacillus sp.]
MIMNKKNGFTALAIILAMLMLAACGGKTYEAVPIQEGVDKCEICNMLIKDDEFAVQLLTKEGKVYKFDDIGCMNEWKTKNASVPVTIEFVRDHASKMWIDLEKAYFAYDASFKTPMAYGLVSFKDKASAEKYISEQGKGKLLSAADLKSHAWERNKAGMDMHHGEGHEQKAHSETDKKGSSH